MFSDRQLKGPYHTWYHRHLFKPLGNGILMEDLVEYRLPLFPLGQIALPFVNKDVHGIFSYRKQAMSAWVEEVNRN